MPATKEKELKEKKADVKTEPKTRDVAPPKAVDKVVVEPKVMKGKKKTEEETKTEEPAKSHDPEAK